jgi:hypothetical protein
MPRHIRFSMTTPQFLDGSKDVTRRNGWKKLKVGDELVAAKKCMGLKAGETIERLGMIRVTDVRRESLRVMIAQPVYGAEECRREGFPDKTPAEFVDFFCGGHTGCTPDSVITRIEFERIPA